MVKRKVKKQVKQKQKQKQNVNVKQNVKVVVGEIKKKRVVKSSGAKSVAGAKPPIVLNISNPQPYNNPYMMYFREQLQNQQPIQANTLAQQVKSNEIEESKASKAGALSKIDQEPNDVARELRRQAAETRAKVEEAKREVKEEVNEIVGSLRKIKTPKPPQRKPRLVLENTSQSENSILSELEQQRSVMEQAISNPEVEDNGASADIESDVPATQLMAYKSPKKPITERPVKRRGRKPLTKEQIQSRIKEEARLRNERIQMIAEDKPRRGRKMLSQEEIDKRKRQRELDKTFEKIFGTRGDTEEDY